MEGNDMATPPYYYQGSRGQQHEFVHNTIENVDDDNNKENM
jgi:hypothetical protein